MPDWPLPSRNTPNVYLLIVSIGCLTVVALLLVSSGTVTGACGDDLAFAGPNTNFSITHQQTTSDVVITHQRGETLTADRTDELYVMIRATGSDNRTRYSLADTPEAFPISSGDQFTIQKATVDGRTLTEGDVIKVVWRGSEKPLPSYCLTNRVNESSSMVLEQYIIE